jgi:hypothetical protein
VAPRSRTGRSGVGSFGPPSTTAEGPAYDPSVGRGDYAGTRQPGPRAALSTAIWPSSDRHDVRSRRGRRRPARRLSLSLVSDHREPEQCDQRDSLGSLT